MGIVHMMIGVPGSGKSTIARKMREEFGYPIVATDTVRDLHPNWDEKKIWPEVYRLCGEYLQNDCDVIYDATNITPLVRLRFIENVKEYVLEFKMIAYVIKADLKTCLERVKLRNQNPLERYLPVNVVTSYYFKLQEPTLSEGFTDIKIIYN